ncbi:hypothetical protein [Chitinophaga vietnamensis]|uniref:hypothetical protein n=1 Tax=Chitinophaga vietnamensis TaxID=2593957 RepID=UPI0011776636|nr:hypothetical protein [Chitinophaga vietnamensis]
MENKPVKRSVVYRANLDQEKNMLIIEGGDGKAYTPESNNIQAFHMKQGEVEKAFVNITINGQKKFYEQLAGGKYTLVEDVKVVFEHANFENRGMIQTGKNYDEYKKESTYYLVENGTATKISLKKKAFMSALDKDARATAAVQQYLRDVAGYEHGFDEVVAAGVIRAANGK